MKVLLSQQEIQSRVLELAAQIRQDYSGEPLLLIGILKGSVHFLSHLALALNGHQHHIDFIQVSSYHGSSSTGVVTMKLDLETNIEGRHVLLVEDIVDTGVTLSYLMENLGGRNPKSLEVVTLLSKPTAHIQYLRLKYIGFEIPPEFVVGFGLDYNEDYRNIADICIYEG